MPLNPPVQRREIHHRVIDMRAYAREDGLFDVEARLVDRKPFPFQRTSTPEPWPAGSALHDLTIRMTVDDQYVVCEMTATSDVTPFGICKETESTLSVLVGQRIASGWAQRVKERLRGIAGCTHLMEMLIPMATTALQGVRGLHPESRRTVGGNGEPLSLDSCYAYARHRDVVKMVWPEHFRPLKGPISPG
jgi:hypothetical protein